MGKKTPSVKSDRLKDSPTKLLSTSFIKKGEFDIRSSVTWGFFTCTLSFKGGGGGGFRGIFIGQNVNLHILTFLAG